MDAAGIVIQVSLLLVELGRRIQRAIEQQKGLPKELERCSNEVQATKSIIDLVQKETVLQEAEAVITAVKRLHVLATSLDDQIKVMGKHRGAVKAFSHQLAHGTAEQHALNKILELLVRGKQNLEVQITLVHVGLTRNARDAIDINTKVVQRIDRAVQRALGPGHCLAIAEFVKAKLKEQRPNADGMLQLTWTEYEAFEEELMREAPAVRPVADERATKQRIVTNNFSDGDALQLNAPIETDLWEDANLVRIDGCVAAGRSIQTNYIQDRQTLRDLLRAREISISMQQRQ